MGVTKYCTRPASALTGAEVVGGTKDPDLERIAQLRPDWVFMNQEENRLEDHQWLAQRFSVDVSLPTGPEDVPPLLRRWGRLVEAEAKAEGWARALERQLQRAPSPPSRGRFAYLIWRKPWMAVGQGTYIDGLLRWAGGENLFGPDPRYPAVDLDRLREDPPDWVFLSSEPFPFKERHRAELRDALGLGDCGPWFRFVDGEAAGWHGVRTWAGLRSVRAWFDRSVCPGRHAEKGAVSSP